MKVGVFRLRGRVVIFSSGCDMRRFERSRYIFFIVLFGYCFLVGFLELSERGTSWEYIRYVLNNFEVWIYSLGWG